MISLGSLKLAAGFAPGAVRARRAASNSSSHPVVEGQTSTPGIEASVAIVRDRHGVPHVSARTEADALFGQGYVHAQDRLFQMELMRRVAAGRLAELAGAPLVESDRFMRRLGLAHRATADAADAAPRDVALLEAYARGVNAGVAALPALPPEFTLLGHEPEVWHPSDTMLIGRLLMFSFATNWESELVRDGLRQALGSERTALLDPAYGTHRATHTGEPYPGSAERLLHAYHSAQRAGAPAGAASNAWVVAGERSVTDQPLLASDPHVETRLPGLFHVSHIRGGVIDAIGADAPGVPGIAMGHNPTLAWGLTAGMADVADCFVETVDPQQRDRYRTPEGWQTAERRSERIEVRGGDAVDEVVLQTRHGPVIEPAEPGADRAIALRCTALEPGDLASPFLGLLRAESLDDLHRAIDGWHGSTFGFVYAEVNGAIGHRLAGSVPRRAPGDGLLPTDGATSPGPSSPREAHELPSIENPEAGFLVAANNAPGAITTLGEDWCEPWRAERISALIEATAQHDVSSFEAIQVDLRSEALSNLRDLILKLPSDRGTPIDLLSDWDGRLAPDSAGAAIVQATYRELETDLLERTGGTAARRTINGGQSSFNYRLPGWVIEQVSEPRVPAFADVADRDRALDGALTRALDGLHAEQGSDASRWSWGHEHQLRFDHPLGEIPVVGGAFSRGARPIGGDVNTVWQASVPALSAERESRGVAPAYRQVIDLADFDRSTFQLPTGVSGIPGHPRYDDCIDEYLDGRTRPLLYTRDAIAAAKESTLVIEPATTR